jgi:dihydroorotate dehydrogenase (fumarate)
MSLSTAYLGLTLKSPLVASASPLNSRLDNIRRLEDAGVAAIVFPSLFQEQIEADAQTHGSRMQAHAESSPEALSYFPAALTTPYGFYPAEYLERLRRAKAATSIPVIGSLNGSSLSGWVEYARHIQDAGADALELNLQHVPADLTETGRDIEKSYLSILEAVRHAVTIPVSVKLTPYLTSIGQFAATLAEAGADGLVLFNRSTQPEIDLVQMKLVDAFDLSEPGEMRLPLLWTAILAGRIKASLAISTGVSTVEDVVKGILAGADVVMTTSALLRHHIEYASTLTKGLELWMERRDIKTIDAMRGLMSLARSRDKSVYTRASYIRMLENYTTPA